MKTILTCKVCHSQHSISTVKIAEKKGKFRCKKCNVWNEFDFILPSSSQKFTTAVLFDLEFKGEVPNHSLQGQIGSDYEKEISLNWDNNRLTFFCRPHSDKSSSRIQIIGLPDPKRMKGFVYDVFPDSTQNNLEITLPDGTNINSGFRLTLFVEDFSEKTIEGRLYLAIPGETQICLHGNFSAKRIYAIIFDENGSFEEKIPDFISNLLNAKMYALAGNTLYLQECFTRLFEEDKIELLKLILSHWPLNQSLANEVHFVEDYLHCVFYITERKLNETFTFLMANQVIPTAFEWQKIKEIVHSCEKEPTFVPLLKKKFLKQFEDQIESIKKVVQSSENLDWLEKDDSSLLDVFLTSGNSPNFIEPNIIKNPLKFSLLHEAIDRSKVKISLRLLEKGADPNVRDLNGETALFKLAQNNSLLLKDKSLLMDEILQKNVNVNFQSVNGMTALHWCSIFGEPTLAKKLIQAKINIHIPDLNGNTSLHEACKFGHSSVLALLLEAGAKPNEKNNDEKTGRDLAFEGLEISDLEGDVENKNRFQRILSLLDVYGG